MKDTITAILWIALILGIILYLLDIKITFKPFSISFGDYINGIGYILFIVGLIIINVTNYNKGKKEGVKNGHAQMLETITTELQKTKSNKEIIKFYNSVNESLEKHKENE